MVWIVFFFLAHISGWRLFPARARGERDVHSAKVRNHRVDVLTAQGTVNEVVSN